jgi:hypothetical protein
MKNKLTINELTPKMATHVLDNRYSDERAKRISDETVKMVFREYLGKNFPWFMKIRNNDIPHKYQLIDVRWKSSNKKNNNYTIMFDFHSNDNLKSTGTDAPYPSEKQQFTMTYEIDTDDIVFAENSDCTSYVYNRAFINALVFFINTSRKIFNKFINSKTVYYAKEKIQLPGTMEFVNAGDEIPKQYAEKLFGHPHIGQKQVENEMVPSRYSAKTFKSFDFSSKDMQLNEIKNLIRNIF